MSASRYKLFCGGSGDGEVTIQMRTCFTSKIELHHCDAWP